jgi:hypothetical protein
MVKNKGTALENGNWQCDKASDILLYDSPPPVIPANLSLVTLRLFFAQRGLAEDTSPLT